MPYGVATDAAGDVFVANGGYSTVEEFSSAGVLLRTLSSGIDAPESVATDAAGDVFVGNLGNNTVEVFSPIGVTTVSDNTTTVNVSNPAVAPTISGTVANQTTTSEATVMPFAGVTIGDTNAGATDTVTIQLFGPARSRTARRGGDLTKLSEAGSGCRPRLTL